MPVVPDRDDSEREVMTSLPRSRPVRRSAKRAPTTATTTAKATATAKKAKAAKPKASSKPAGKSSAKSKGKTKAKAASNGAAPRIPRAEEPAAPPRRKVPAAGYAAPSSGAEESESALADLVTTTLQAAQELTQIGLDVGRAAVRSMLDRLPRA
jgi:hypothetical protein